MNTHYVFLFFWALIIYVICLYTNLENMEETNGNNSLPQQEKNSRRGKGRGKGHSSWIPHCTLPFSFVTIWTRGVTLVVATTIKGVITPIGTFKQDLHAKGKWTKSTLSY
jgi:hypothetical protein